MWQSICFISPKLWLIAGFGGGDAWEKLAAVWLGPAWSRNAFPGHSIFLFWVVRSGPTAHPEGLVVEGITQGIFMLFHNSNNNMSWQQARRPAPKTKTWISQR